MATSINAPGPRRLHSPRVTHLRAMQPRQLDAPLDRHLASPRPKRLPRDSGKGSFMPGLSAELDETEVMVGFESPDQLAQEMGAFDVQSLLTKQNVLVLAGAAVLGYFAFKR